MIREDLAEGVTIYHGDCLEILPNVGRISHCICDPPYENIMHDLHASTKLRRTDGGPQRRELDFAGVTDIRKSFIELVKNVNDGWLLAFCNVEGVAYWREDLMDAGLKFKTTMAWLKLNSAPQFNGQGPALGFECVTTSWCGSGHSSWNGGGRRGILEHPVNNSEREGTHPSEKPISLMCELISLFTQPGDIVCDPFMGSGTTGIACIKSGRRFIGIEMKEEYYLVAKERIKNALAMPDMFIERPNKPKQLKMF